MYMPEFLNEMKSVFYTDLHVPLQETLAHMRPHSMKAKAAGCKVLMLCIILFSDDTCGSRS